LASRRQKGKKSILLVPRLLGGPLPVVLTGWRWVKSRLQRVFTPLTMLKNPTILRSDAVFGALGNRQAELSHDGLLTAMGKLLIAMSFILAILDAQLETKGLHLLY
jgi:hypothetical protein